MCLFFQRLKEAQENIKKITAEKRVETKKINANSLVRSNIYSPSVMEFPKSCLTLASTLKSIRLIFMLLPTEREVTAEGSQHAVQLKEMMSRNAEEERLQ